VSKLALVFAFVALLLGGCGESEEANDGFIGAAAWKGRRSAIGRPSTVRGCDSGLGSLRAIVGR